jgi:SET domain-containing protein
MPTARRKRPYSVRRSPIHGRGVFATRTIRSGARIVEYRGKRLAPDEVDWDPYADPANPYHTFLFETADGTTIDAGVRGNAARWINHSCAPNCETCEDDDGRVYIEARRTIKAGEELTYDYRLNYEGRMTKRVLEAYTCRCGAPRCRGSLLLKARKRR